LEALADISIDEMTTRIEKKPEEISLGGLHDTTNLALKALGFGGHKNNGNGDGNGNGVHAHFHFGSQEDKLALQEARGKMIQANSNEIDVTPIKEAETNGYNNGEANIIEGDIETQ
jgi:hypothetical protein